MGNRHLEVVDLGFYSSVHSDVWVFTSPLLQKYFILNTKGNGRLRMAERTLKALVNSVFEISRESGPVRSFETGNASNMEGSCEYIA
jgi:hypothetical protein